MEDATRITRKKSFNTVLFDLDGTLTDSSPGIIRSILYALERMGIDELDVEKLKAFIGPPLRESFRIHYSLDPASAERAVAHYRDYFSHQGLYENYLYPGISELLQDLRGKNKTLAVATTKPSVYARKILRHFEIDHYFSVITGSYLDGRRSHKAGIIRYTLTRLGGIKSGDAVMVGDRHHDILGARENKIHSIGVLYGYGSPEEIGEANPTWTAKTTGELRRLFSAG